MKKSVTLLMFILVLMLLSGCKSKATRVQEQLDLGSKYMAELDYESAIVALNKAIKIDPKNVDVYKMLAKVYEKSGRLDDARATLEKVLDLDNLSSDNEDEINDRIKNLEFLVAISKLPGEYDEPTALELSNTGSNDIYYSIDTKDSRLLATDMKYTSPILLDEDGSYIVKAYTVDSSGNKYDSTEVKYTIKLSKEHSEKDSWEGVGNIYRYRGKDGKIVTGWQQIDGSWYYFKENGDMATGVADINGVKYCFDEDGVMLTGWQQIDGKWYYFADNGEMVTDQYIDGYYIGTDGVRTDIMQEPVPPSKNYTDQIVYKKNSGDGEEKVWERYVYYKGISVNGITDNKNTQIFDRGSYYEVTNVDFGDLNYGSLYGEEGSIAFTTTIYIRKNAVISIGTAWYEDYEIQVMTAEECYNKYNKLSSHDILLSIFMGKKFKVDSQGYIIEFNDFAVF